VNVLIKQDRGTTKISNYFSCFIILKLKNLFHLLSNTYQQYRKICIYIYYISLTLIPVGLLFSRALLSIGFLAFISNWFIEGEFKQKWHLIKQYKADMIISLILLIHIIGMLNTENIEYGLLDLKIKLPLLLPLFFGSSKSLLSVHKSSVFLNLFAFSTFIATLTGFIKFEYILEYQTIDDLRNITIMGQNIMLSLFVNFSIFIFSKLLYTSWYIKGGFTRISLIFCIIWLIIFQYLLNSLTGYITFIILVLYSLIFLLLRLNKKKLFFTIAIIIGLTGISFSFYIHSVINNFYEKEEIDFKMLDKYTVNGSLYSHNLASYRTENGHFIDIYICMDELENEWRKVSSMSLFGKDKKAQALSETLIRYMSSRGLRKDSIGLHQLGKDEISYIENGCANYKYINKFSLESRIYNIIWQIETYKKTGIANAQSISQRIEFLKSAQLIIRENFWFGVGTGDVMQTFNQTLEKNSPKLNSQFRNRVHNQYIVELAALGFWGFVVFMFVIIYPIFKQKIWNNYLFSTFYLIILISFLTDNPLETQLGVGFFIYFYCLLVFKDIRIQHFANKK